MESSFSKAAGKKGSVSKCCAKTLEGLIGRNYAEPQKMNEEFIFKGRGKKGSVSKCCAKTLEGLIGHHVFLFFLK